MIMIRRRPDAHTRARAAAIARQLRLWLYDDTVSGPAATVGVILQPGERVWAHLPARWSADSLRDPRDPSPRETVTRRTHSESRNNGYAINNLGKLTAGRGLSSIQQLASRAGWVQVPRLSS
jgi:hypothetical protein